MNLVLLSVLILQRVLWISFGVICIQLWIVHRGFEGGHIYIRIVATFLFTIILGEVLYGGSVGLQVLALGNPEWLIFLIALG